MFVTLLILAAVLSLLVFVHEFGHFITAKRAGIGVEEFGFGFPPRAVSVKRGGTIYSINWIPLGGFVKIKGESGEAKGDPDSFSAKSIAVRALVLSAGVLMNVALCWFLLSFGYVIGLPQVAEDLSPSARVAAPKVQIVDVLKDSPAARAGLEAGDTIVSIDGAAVTEAEQVRTAAAARMGGSFDVTLDRAGARLEKTLSPQIIVESGKPGIGIALMKTGLVSYPWYLAPAEGLHATWAIGTQIVAAFGGVFHDLFLGKKIETEFSGPVGIAFLTADVARLGFRHVL